MRVGGSSTCCVTPRNLLRQAEINQMSACLRFGIFSAAVALTFSSSAVAQPRDGSLEPQQPPIQARPGGPESSPKSDQTVDVAKGTRLVLSNNAGEVVVRSWD